MSAELYKVERPATIADIIGNGPVKGCLTGYAENPRKMPHAILLTGPSGTGKTTVARIICNQILEIHRTDLAELNCADVRGIEMVRDISEQMRKSPRAGKYRAWVIDEAHMLTKPAQEAFLKMLEDTPKHVYFFLATTDPRALIDAIKTRTTNLVLKSLTEEQVGDYLVRVAKKHKIKVDSDAVEKIAEVSEGSMRKALVLLDQIRHIPEADRLDFIQRSDIKTMGIDLCRELLKPKPSWASLTKILRSLDEDAEGVRRMVLGYLNTIALKSPGQAPRALRVMGCFRDNYYDTGKAGLTISCGEVVFDES